ncbi:MAG TPA: glucose-6-phosphate dehydrogenase assembly protein OpcA [Bryobacteraceae bacterium]|nr:glucose-6-phosphate dehydrogenase assembly protein OpcA [Bryobacteraceae bacterium]
MITLNPESLLRDLRRLWRDLGRGEEHGVLRACAMTLIVAVIDSGDEQRLGETIAALMHEHPSRAILLHIRAGDSEYLDARVNAQCWMPFGKRQQICCEQIEITVGLGRLHEAAGLLSGLTVPDLPVVLWCVDPEMLELASFRGIVPLATKLIVDGERAQDSADFLRRLYTLLRKPQRCADLAWGRLTPWRESVAQVFEDAAARKIMYDLAEIRILYARKEDPVSAYYLAGWFMHVLGGGPHVKIARGVGPAYGEIARISLHGEGFEAAIELMATCAIETTVNGATHRLVLPEETTYNALREELGIAGADRVYEDVLGLAALMRGVAE